jgi:hypothetical protein
MMTLFMPLVCSYYGFSSNAFINISVQNATGLEWMGNRLLSPVQFILAGKEAKQLPDGSWEFTQRFDYENLFWIKATSSIIALPPSLILGTAVKGLSLMSSSGKEHYEQLCAELKSRKVHSHEELYKKMGMEIAITAENFTSQGHQRRPGDENTLCIEKEALKDIAQLLNEAKIPWWVDCGTCLGAYRYGGVIPWDEDIDIAVLLPDFHNVRKALNGLDPKKYIVQDWSSRSRPDSYIKVFIRQTSTLVDIYHFAIDPEKKEIRYVLSLETNLFFPDWWKIRERRFTASVSFDTVFPLKRAQFDGVEVFVPNKVQKYLQRCYGENLDPVKIYNPITDCYEKELSHPYWQREFAH